MNDQLQATARKLLRLPTDEVLHSLKKFAEDREFLKALHHSEKMGRGRGKVVKGINQLLHPTSTMPPSDSSKPAPKTKSSKPAKPAPLIKATPDASIVQVDPRGLVLAPELAAVPMVGAVIEHYRSKPKAAALLAEMDAERQGSHQSMDEIGIIDPLKVTLHANGSTGKVWDGRHRLEWALSRGKETVPVIPVTEEEGRKLMEASVIGRRHWTKGQRAYLGVLCHPEVAGVTAGRPKKEAGLSATELAARLGVSADVVGQAVTIYKACHAPGAKAGSAEAIEAADCKAKYEMSIWAGAGLGAVIAGMGGGKATHEKPRNESGWASLDKPLGTMTRLGREYEKWDEEHRSKALRLMTTRFKTDFTPAFRLALSEALAAADDSMSNILG